MENCIFTWTHGTAIESVSTPSEIHTFPWNIETHSRDWLSTPEHCTEHILSWHVLSSSAPRSQIVTKYKYFVVWWVCVLTWRHCVAFIKCTSFTSPWHCFHHQCCYIDLRGRKSSPKSLSVKPKEEGRGLFCDQVAFELFCKINVRQRIRKSRVVS